MKKGIIILIAGITGILGVNLATALIEDVIFYSFPIAQYNPQVDLQPELDKLYQEIKEELDDEEDQAINDFMNELTQMINDLLQDSENFDPVEFLKKYQEIIKNYQEKISTVQEKEDFLNEIKDLSYQDLLKKRDELAAEGSKKYDLLVGYMNAQNKQKYIAEKMTEFNKEKQEARNEMFEKLDNLFQEYADKQLDSEFFQKYTQIQKEYNDKLNEIETLENFLYELQALSPQELEAKKDELLKAITENPDDPLLQWKLDILARFISVYENAGYKNRQNFYHGLGAGGASYPPHLDIPGPDPGP